MPFEAHVAGSQVLTAEMRLRPSAHRLRLFEPGVAVRRLAVTHAAAGPSAIAGDYVAYLAGASNRPDAVVYEVRVVNWRTGALLTKAVISASGPFAGDVEGLDLAPDGRAILSVDHRVLAVAPGLRHGMALGGLREDLIRAQFAGPRVIALRGSRFDALRPVLLPSGGGRSRPIGPPSTELSAWAAADGKAVWVANGCLLTTGVDDPAFAAPPVGPCPRAEIVLEGGEQVLRGRSAEVVVDCVAAPPSGCRGVAMLRGSAVARGRFRVRAGQRSAVKVRFSNAGAREVRHEIRRKGGAMFGLRARVIDGRVSVTGVANAFIDRVRPR